MPVAALLSLYQYADILHYPIPHHWVLIYIQVLIDIGSHTKPHQWLFRWAEHVDDILFNSQHNQFYARYIILQVIHTIFEDTLLWCNIIGYPCCKVGVGQGVFEKPVGIAWGHQALCDTCWPPNTVNLVKSASWNFAFFSFPDFCYFLFLRLSPFQKRHLLLTFGTKLHRVFNALLEYNHCYFKAGWFTVLNIGKYTVRSPMQSSTTKKLTNQLLESEWVWWQ